MAFGGGVVAVTDDGKAKFERQLKMVGLDGQVPADLAKGMIWGQRGAQRPDAPWRTRGLEIP